MSAEPNCLTFIMKGEAPQILFAHATGFLPWLWHPIIEDIVPPNQTWVPYICNYRECDPEKGGLAGILLPRIYPAFAVRKTLKIIWLSGIRWGLQCSPLPPLLFGMKPRAMILIEPIFLPEEFYSLKVSVKDHPLASKSIKRTNHWKNEEEAWAYLKSKSLFSDWDEEVLALYLKYGMEKQKAGDLKLACTPESEAAMFMGGWSRNPWPLLDKLTCPVLVVEGEKSDNKEFIDLKKAVSLLHHGKYKSVAGAGHLIPMQKPKEVAQIIKEFLAEII